jgi:organic hydroperoxide reductase OsmC/OhrA
MSLRQAVTSPATIAWLRATSRCRVVAHGRERAARLVDDATEHCPVCQAIRGNVAMQATAQFDAV